VVVLHEQSFSLLAMMMMTRKSHLSLAQKTEGLLLVITKRMLDFDTRRARALLNCRAIALEVSRFVLFFPAREKKPRGCRFWEKRNSREKTSREKETRPRYDANDNNNNNNNNA
jgi:hypothetical protein